MARKRRKLSRKERQQQRREAMERKRKERDWEPRQEPSTRRQTVEVIEDMLPLFPTITDASASPGPAMEQITMILSESGYMADEPEFEEIIVDPMLCMDTFAEVVQELGIDPASLEEFSVEDREDTQMRILEGIIGRLLTDEFRQDILNGLNDLRLRLKQSGDREETAKAAALQSFLSGDETEGIWPMVGLVQAIFYRSIQVGFELMKASTEIMEIVDPDKRGVSLSEKLAQSKVAQKVDSLLKKVPGLHGFLEKQADHIWEEGLDAVFTGELGLELFSPEEIGTGFEMFQTAFQDDIAETMETQDLRPLEMSQEKGMALVLQWDSYLTELFTPERLDQLRARLEAILKDPAYAGKWFPFLYMLAEYMADEDAVKNEKQFLITALAGEMRAVSTAFQEAERNEQES